MKCSAATRTGLIDAFNLSRAELQTVILRIREASQMIDSARAHIAEADDGLAQREALRSASVRATADSTQHVFGCLDCSQLGKTPIGKLRLPRCTGYL